MQLKLWRTLFSNQTLLRNILSRKVNFIFYILLPWIFSKITIFNLYSHNYFKMIICIITFFIVFFNVIFIMKEIFFFLEFWVEESELRTFVFLRFQYSNCSVLSVLFLWWEIRYYYQTMISNLASVQNIHRSSTYTCTVSVKVIQDFVF